jgi:hypothetical protein
MIEQERFSKGLQEASEDDVRHVFAAAIALERALYDGNVENTNSSLFRLRKSLEGIYGCDLPEVNEWGNNL